MPMHNLWNHSRADGVASTKPVPKLSQQPPHKQEPVGPAPHSTTTSPSLLTSNGATRHTASPVSHQLPHNQASPHNNASPLNYMYQWTHTFPAPNTTHGTSGTISPHCNWTYISTGASSCPLQSTVQSPPPPQTAYGLGTPTVLDKPSFTSGATSPHTMCKLPVPIGATVYLFSVHTILSEVK